MSLGVQDIKTVLQRPDLGILIIRVALGVVLALAGWEKLSGGESTLHSIGSSVKFIGLEIGENNAFTLFFGIAAAGSELIGGILIIFGWLFRTASFLLLGTMVVATALQYQVSQGDITQYGYPMIIGLVLLGLIFTGPAKISIQKD